MLTYDLTGTDQPLYQCLYGNIKKDIHEGKLLAGEKLPSKRAFARNLGISTITVEKAYDQLISEGFLYSLPKKGYYVARISHMENVRSVPDRTRRNIRTGPEEAPVRFDFSSHRTLVEDFPFSVWARLMRETMSLREQELLEVSPSGGVKELREAIASHLLSFRGMAADPDQIIVGAGTEYLYGLLIHLLGKDRVYCVENPGYRKISQIYQTNDVRFCLADLDEQGIIVEEIRKGNADIAHICPTHQFPTGITMPVSRRYELLAWAAQEKGRYIIEDDYDSEFRLKGKPVPSLFGIDAREKVIYMNTFSKSLTSTIRISYMVLPENLASRFYRELSFYSCTVSTFEQYTLAAFIQKGYFEKHINRMRLKNGRRRKEAIERIRAAFPGDLCRILEEDSGLHILLQFHTDIPDREIEKRLLKRGVRILAVTDFDMKESREDRHQFILNYAGIDMNRLDRALACLKEILE